jgi:hypothetical protein
VACPSIHSGFREAVDRLLRVVTASWIKANLCALAQASKENWHSRAGDALNVIEHTIKRWQNGKLLPSQPHQDLLDLYLECIEQQLRTVSNYRQRSFDEYRPPRAARRAAGLRGALIEAGGEADVLLIDLMILRFTKRAEIGAIRQDLSNASHNRERICREMEELGLWLETAELSGCVDVTTVVLPGILECQCAESRCSKLGLSRLQGAWSRWGEPWERVTDCIIQPEP